MKEALDPAAASEAIRSHATGSRTEKLPLRLCVGRTLRQTVYAERDNPPFDRVCMDGIAIASTALKNGRRTFWLQGIQGAGSMPHTLAAPDAAIEIMTGAVLPHGTDSVIPMEEYHASAGEVTLKAEAAAEPWRNVQRRGSESPSGIAMLREGIRLGATEIAVIASAGLAEVEVSCQPRIQVISTGDELVDPGQPIAGHQVRRSNAYGIAAALQLHGFESVSDAHLPDDEPSMQHHLRQILARKDVLILSGGVSHGKFDFVPAALKALGVRQVFHEIAQRPGRPMWFGIGPRGEMVFGLPGNPVSTLVCLVRYVLPALRASIRCHSEPQERIALAEAQEGRRMTYFMPVKLLPQATTLATASARPPKGSGDFLALAGTDGFVELPPRKEGYPQGFIADFHRW